MHAVPTAGPMSTTDHESPPITESMDTTTTSTDGTCIMTVIHADSYICS